MEPEESRHHQQSALGHIDYRFTPFMLEAPYKTRRIRVDLSHVRKRASQEGDWVVNLFCTVRLILVCIYIYDHIS